MLGAVRGLGQLVGLRKSPIPTLPTVFHVTHHKAGSQWINRIFHTICYDRLVLPEVENTQFFKQPIVPGAVYPTVYVTREQFESVALPRRTKRFVIIRDLRDTLISLYFSLRYSHEIQTEYIRTAREDLSKVSVEDGLREVMRQRLWRIAQFQWSWRNAREKLIRYEDLLKNDEEILSRVLIRQCGLDVKPQRLREVIRANRFEARSGRRPGTEDIASHERKGIAGDWRTHFTPIVTSEFKTLFGSVLIATGYEKDFNW